MYIYKELSFCGDKTELDRLAKDIYNVFPKEWIKPQGNSMLRDYICADYVGEQAPHAEVSIYYGKDTWRDGYVKVCNIVPLQKNQLTIEEYNQLLDLFYNDIAKVYGQTHDDIKVVGPSSGRFNPLDYISESALNKLTLFCNAANKSTGSSHSSDEERWFDFICQTVDDRRTFDYDTLFRFLQDEEYWGKKEDEFLGVIGHFAWSEENAKELALEYENYVRFLQHYKEIRRVE